MNFPVQSEYPHTEVVENETEREPYLAIIRNTQSRLIHIADQSDYPELNVFIDEITDEQVADSLRTNSEILSPRAERLANGVLSGMNYQMDRITPQWVGPFEEEKRKNDRMLRRKIVEESIAIAFNTPFLLNASKDEVTDEELLRYVGERLQSGDGFIRFLNGVFDSMEKAGEYPMARAIYTNICDELGYDGEDVQMSRVHNTWRNQMRAAIARNVAHDPEKVKLLHPQTTPATDAYRNELTELLETDDPIRITSGFCMLELAIALEYEQMHNVMRTRFQLSNADMLYMDSHRLHDLRHFLEGYVPLAGMIFRNPDAKSMKSAMEGIEKVSNAKRRFFKELEKQNI